MKIQGIGLPFSPHQSSCSNRKPKTFEWTYNDSEIQVWMDMHIPIGVNQVKLNTNTNKRYGWFCESREVVPYLQDAFDSPKVLDEIVNAYDGIFTCDRELVDKHEKIHFCLAGSNLPWISKLRHKIYEKTKLCSFIASNKRTTHGHIQRHRVYDKLKIRVEGEPIIELFGTITGYDFGANPGCHIESKVEVPWHDKCDGLNDFMFSIVIENARYDDYFTEKITDCFATGTIPVYWGTRNIGDYFNTDGIIVIPDNGDGWVDVEILDFILSNKLTSDLYYSKMNAIKDNFERVKSMQSADDMLFEKIQELNN
tara:strand:- start:623 stop:1555 length:933 start_codon:yes stop_codon:yes gene_type:complete